MRVRLIFTGSGQSPNSIHTGSPPSITAPPPSLLANKRPGYYLGNDGLPTKKPRISHYKKPEPISFVAAGEKTSGVSGNVTGGGGGGGGGGSSNGNYNSNNSGVNVAVVGDYTSDRATDRTADRIVNSANSSATGGNATGIADVWDHPRQTQQTQRERTGRLDYRAERTANSDVRGTGNHPAAVTGASGSRSSCLISSPSDNGRGSHHQSGGRRDGGGVAAISAGGSSDTNADRRDRSDRNRSAREDRESRNRSSSSSASNTIAHNNRASTSTAVPSYVDFNATTMTSSRMDVFQIALNSDPSMCRDYLT